MFSVIIPLYNKELSIINTINSVLNQSIQLFEIIVINDGSSDRSLEMLESINDERLRVYSKANGGVSSARNYGIDKASFNWIAFLDGDDLWNANHLEEVFKMINDFPEAKLFATSFNYSDNRKMRKISNKPPIWPVEDYFRDCLQEHLIWTSVFTGHKSCFEQDRFDVDLALGEDIELWGRLVKKNSLVKSSLITATYRINAENRSDKKKYDLKRSFLLKLSFNKMTSSSEKKYYRKYVSQIFKNAIVKKDWTVAIRLVLSFNLTLFRALAE